MWSRVSDVSETDVNTIVKTSLYQLRCNVANALPSHYLAILVSIVSTILFDTRDIQLSAPAGYSYERICLRELKQFRPHEIEIFSFLRFSYHNFNPLGPSQIINIFTHTYPLISHPRPHHSDTPKMIWTGPSRSDTRTSLLDPSGKKIWKSILLCFSGSSQLGQIKVIYHM